MVPKDRLAVVKWVGESLWGTLWGTLWGVKILAGWFAVAEWPLRRRGPGCGKNRFCFFH